MSGAVLCYLSWMILSCPTLRSTLRFVIRFGLPNRLTTPFVTSLQNKAVAPSCEFRTLYAVRDGVLGVPEPDGSWRLVILDGTLRTDICRYFHDEFGILCAHRDDSSLFLHPHVRAFLDLPQ